MQPNPVVLGQGFTQKILREHLEKLGTTVETETELREFKQDAEGVTATLVKHKGSEETAETVRFRYLVGTDGGRSASLISVRRIVVLNDRPAGIVRKSLGLSFEGKELDQGIILGELELEGLGTDVRVIPLSFLAYHLTSCTHSTGTAGPTGTTQRWSRTSPPPSPSFPN